MKYVEIPWVRVRYTMGRGDQYAMGRGVNMPWVGVRYTMGKERVQYILIIMSRKVIKYTNFQKI